MNNVQPGLPLKLVHRGFPTETDTGTNMNRDMLSTVFDQGHDDSEGFDSAELVLFNHSQRISVVTGD